MNHALLISHDNCNDGAASMAVMENWATANNIIYTTEFMQYGKLPPNENLAILVSGNNKVIMTDFSFPVNTFTYLLINTSANFEVYDHHIGVAEDLLKLSLSFPDRFKYVFNNNACGCLIFHKEKYPDEKPHKLLEAIDDRDRWQFKLPNTKEFNNALYAVKNMVRRTKDIKYILEEDFDYRIGTLLQQGKLITQMRDETILSLAKPEKWKRTFIMDREVYASNIPPEYVSETCNLVCERTGTIALGFMLDLANKDAICSLRSIGDLDTLEISKPFGGGGHKNASGFSLYIPTFMEYFK